MSRATMLQADTWQMSKLIGDKPYVVGNYTAEVTHGIMSWDEDEVEEGLRIMVDKYHASSASHRWVWNLLMIRREQLIAVKEQQQKRHVPKQVWRQNGSRSDFKIGLW